MLLRKNTLLNQVFQAWQVSRGICAVDFDESFIVSKSVITDDSDSNDSRVLGSQFHYLYGTPSLQYKETQFNF